MSVWVLFFLYTGIKEAASFQYEFKDKVQCEHVLENMKKHFDIGRSTNRAFCQEVRK